MNKRSKNTFQETVNKNTEKIKSLYSANSQKTPKRNTPGC